MTDTQFTESQQALARMRHLTTAPPEESRETRRRVQPYVRATVYIFENVELDPQREVLSEWLPTLYDRLTTIKEDPSRPPGQRIDAGDGWGVVINTGGPFKVRSIHKPSMGAVRELNAVEYWLCAREASTGRAPRWEPVPASCAVRPPVLPPNFPSDAKKARAIAARGLKVAAPESLEFPAILGWFTSKAATARPVFKLT